MTDAQGAVLPGVTVTLTGRTGSQSTVSDDSGVFRFVGLNPGPYSLRAELSGFRPYEEPNLDLAIGRTITLRVGLLLGAVAETVEVVATSPIVDTTTTATDTTISQDLLFSMPISRTNAASSMLNYAPGVNSGSAFGGPAGSGQRACCSMAWIRATPRAARHGSSSTTTSSTRSRSARSGSLPSTVASRAPSSTRSPSRAAIATRASSSIATPDKGLRGDNISDEVKHAEPSAVWPRASTSSMTIPCSWAGPSGATRPSSSAASSATRSSRIRTGPRTIRTEVSPRFNTKVTFQPTRGRQHLRHLPVPTSTTRPVGPALRRRCGDDRRSSPSNRTRPSSSGTGSTGRCSDRPASSRRSSPGIGGTSISIRHPDGSSAHRRRWLVDRAARVQREVRSPAQPAQRVVRAICRSQRARTTSSLASRSSAARRATDPPTSTMSTSTTSAACRTYAYSYGYDVEGDQQAQHVLRAGSVDHWALDCEPWRAIRLRTAVKAPTASSTTRPPRFGPRLGVAFDLTGRGDIGAAGILRSAVRRRHFRHRGAGRFRAPPTYVTYEVLPPEADWWRSTGSRRRTSTASPPTSTTRASTNSTCASSSSFSDASKVHRHLHPP